MVTDLYLHVGPHKTGTTFLQNVLEDNADALAEDGVALLGRSHEQQYRAMNRLVRRPRRFTRSAAWVDFVRVARRTKAPVGLISSEHLDLAGTRARRALVDALAPERTHVVYTARDLTAVIPALWQTYVRNGSSTTWEEYIGALRSADRSKDWPWGLAGQDPRRYLRAWEPWVEPADIHVITVPPPGSDPSVLWRRFASVLGLRADRYVLEDAERRPSLGMAETHLLQCLNEALEGSVSRRTWKRYVQLGIGGTMLEARPDQQRAGLGRDDHAWVAEQAEGIIDFLATCDYDVVGDLAEIRPRARVQRPEPGTADDAELLGLALDSLRYVLEVREAENTRRHAFRRVLSLQGGPASPPIGVLPVPRPGRRGRNPGPRTRIKRAVLRARSR